MAPVPEETSIIASDGVRLGGTFFRPSEPERGAVLVLCGTAIPARFYATFATFLSERGYLVLTFDYRGVGRSRVTDRKKDPATMSEWAQLDMDAALLHLRSASAAPILCVAHSFGGQGLGLAKSAPELVRAMVLVGSQNGDLTNWPFWSQLRNRIFFSTLVPIVSRQLGYFPGKIAFGEDLPRGVIEEWGKWCRTREYLFAYFSESERYHEKIEAPLLSVQVSDDELAPTKAAEALLAHYSAATITRRHVDPKAEGWSSLGHFGYFRKSATKLWPEVAEFFDAITEGPKSPSVTKASA